MRKDVRSFCRVHAIVSIIMLTTLIAARNAHGGLSDGGDGVGPSANSETHAEHLPDHELGYGFLVSEEALKGQLGAIYRQFKHLGNDLRLSMVYITHSPDGTTSRIEMNGLDELKRYVDQVRQDRNNYAILIRDRGFRTLATSYTAIVSDQCADDWMEPGEVTVSQSDFSLRFGQGEKVFHGASVGRSVTVIFPGGQQLPLFGMVKKHGHVELVDNETKCQVRLTPVKGLMRY